MSDFIRFVGKDGSPRAVREESIRMLADDADVNAVIVTLCDGSSFSATGSVEEVLRSIGK